jgi:hypothetical protein
MKDAGRYLRFLQVCVEHTMMHVNGVLTVTQLADHLKTTRQAHGLCRDQQPYDRESPRSWHRQGSEVCR